MEAKGGAQSKSWMEYSLKKAVSTDKPVVSRNERFLSLVMRPCLLAKPWEKKDGFNQEMVKIAQSLIRIAQSFARSC